MSSADADSGTLATQAAGVLEWRESFLDLVLLNGDQLRADEFGIDLRVAVFEKHFDDLA
jgi:hypothetical protein